MSVRAAVLPTPGDIRCAARHGAPQAGGPVRPLGERGSVKKTDSRRVVGIDFSGAKDAGKKIWIASGVTIGSDELQATIVGNTGGDALDSAIAAFAVHAAVQDPALLDVELEPGSDVYVIEGYVYA